MSSDFPGLPGTDSTAAGEEKRYVQVLLEMI